MKRCCDCKWYKPFTENSIDQCMKDDIDRMLSPVDGSLIYMNPKDARSVNHNNLCGPEGNWFEEIIGPHKNLFENNEKKKRSVIREDENKKWEENYRRGMDIIERKIARPYHPYFMPKRINFLACIIGFIAAWYIIDAIFSIIKYGPSIF